LIMRLCSRSLCLTLMATLLTKDEGFYYD
jgi:hypothetical protein